MTYFSGYLLPNLNIVTRQSLSLPLSSHPHDKRLTQSESANLFDSDRRRTFILVIFYWQGRPRLVISIDVELGSTQPTIGSGVIQHNVSWSSSLFPVLHVEPAPPHLPVPLVDQELLGLPLAYDGRRDIHLLNVMLRSWQARMKLRLETAL